MAEVDFEQKYQIDGGELLLGCGYNRKKQIKVKSDNIEWAEEFRKLTTLDMNSACEPDYVWNLNHMPLPFADNCFDEIHAYEVLEHCGEQGDFQFFFKQFEEFWRILKPGGLVCATVPAWDSIWAWGDPGHTRVISAGSLVFLNQAHYEKELGDTPMSDYRPYYKGNFNIVSHNGDTDAERFAFVLEAIKDGDS